MAMIEAENMLKVIGLIKMKNKIDLQNNVTLKTFFACARQFSGSNSAPIRPVFCGVHLSSSLGKLTCLTEVWTTTTPHGQEVERQLSEVAAST